MSGHFHPRRGVFIVPPGTFRPINPSVVATRQRKTSNKRIKHVDNGVALRINAGTQYYPGQIQDVQLSGFKALRKIFPEVPQQLLIQTLAGVDDVPTAQRAAMAARILIAKKCIASRGLATAVVAPTLKEAQPQLQLRRTVTATPGLIHTSTVNQVSQTTPLPIVLDTAKSAVPNLAAWLDKLGLSNYFDAASSWVDLQGACDLGEIVENLEDFATTLHLEPATAAQLHKNAKSVAVAVTSQTTTTPTCAVSTAPTQSQLCTAVSTPVVLHGHMQLESTHPTLSVARTNVQVSSTREVVHDDTRSFARSTSFSSEWDGVLSRGFSLDPQPTIRQRRQINKPARWRGYTPPKYRCRVDPKLLRAPIPTSRELQAVEIAQQTTNKANVGCEGEEGLEAQVQDSMCLHTFRGMQSAFISEHGDQIRKELGPGVCLVPTNLSSGCEEKFLATCQNAGELPTFGYHGTRQENHSSIFNQGLRVPGNGGVTIAHGSAHGVGIYTAMPGAAYLSQGFCNSQDLLVCGIVDKKLEEPSPLLHTISTHQNQHRNHHRPFRVAPAMPAQFPGWGVKKDDGVIREVGNARIIFDEAYVAPLLIARGGGDSRASADSNTGLPCNMNKLGSQRAGKAQIVIAESGEKVWLPPEEIRGWNCMRVKRRLAKKKRDRQRHSARMHKAEHHVGDSLLE